MGVRKINLFEIGEVPSEKAREPCQPSVIKWGLAAFLAPHGFHARLLDREATSSSQVNGHPDVPELIGGFK